MKAITILCFAALTAFLALILPFYGNSAGTLPAGDGIGLTDPSESSESGMSASGKLPAVSPFGYGAGSKLPDGEKAVYIKSEVNSLRVRSGPGTEYSVLGTLDKGDMAVFEGEEGDWYLTTYIERPAYISRNAAYTSLLEIEKGSSAVESVIDVAETLLGYPYIFGSQRYHWGNGILNTDFVAGEFDCSALTLYAYFKGAGITLGLTTRDQVKQGERVDGELQRGDLLFFTNASRYDLTGTERVGHVAIYLGSNYILHTASDHAVIEPISEKRRSYFIEARRLIAL